MKPGLRALALAGPSLLFLLLLLLCELSVRLLLPPLSGLEVMVRDPVQRASLDDRRRVSIFVADPLLLWNLKPKLKDVIWDFTPVTTNAVGLRHPRELEPKTQGGFRVVCVGDSVTFGYRVPVVWPERPTDYDRAAAAYPRLIEQQLRSQHPRVAIDVLTLAVPGYSSRQGRLLLQREIAPLQPDLVLALFGWNDTNLRPIPDRETFPEGGLPVAMRSLLLHSQVLLRLALFVRGGGGSWVAGHWRVSAEDFALNHLEMARLAHEHSAAFAAIAPVYGEAVTFPEEAQRIQALREALRRAFAQRGLPLLEVPELFESTYPGNRKLFGETIHPNHLGHQLLAERAIAFLRERGMLEPFRARARTPRARARTGPGTDPTGA